jgi:hypothetical protein
MNDTSVINCPHCGEDINTPVRPYPVGTPALTDHGVVIPVWQNWQPQELPNSEAMTNE